MQPIAGTLYRSAINSDHDLIIEDVIADNEAPGFYLVHACHPSAKDNPQSLDRSEHDPEEWEALITSAKLTPITAGTSQTATPAR
ncbi:MAG: hypothetical protein RugAbin2_02420 [Rugosibacter sp.]|nr:hypothetical protein [Rugosibacter sp.]